MKEMIDSWDHPSTAWIENFTNFFEDGLGFQMLDRKPNWEFGDNMQDLITNNKMLLEDVKEWVHVAEVALR